MKTGSSISLILLLFFSLSSFAEGEHKAANRKCFDCHAATVYHYYNDWLEEEVRERMSPFLIVDSLKYYNAAHHTFYCTDCHSPDYESFPHDEELRLEPLSNCMDCHEGDDDYAAYHFEIINEEYHESIHSLEYKNDFSCWKCHNPHTYQALTRNESDLKSIITHDNESCLYCHANEENFIMVSDSIKPDIKTAHSWLPNNKLHFESVRCLDCHASQHDSLYVPHKILSANESIKECISCHSKNSILFSTLYKYNLKEERATKGIIQASLTNKAYLIGSQKNTFLNNLILILLGMIFFSILIHGIFRLIYRSK